MPKDNGVSYINGKRFTVLTNLNVTGEFRTDGTLLGEALIKSASTAAEQTPASTDDPIQIEFGDAQENEYLSLAADGSLTVKRAGFYQIIVNVTFGRDTNTGVAVLLGRFSVNGEQPSNASTLSATLPNNRFRIPKQITVTSQFPKGAVIKFELARDSAGNNSGGLYRFQPTTLGWNDAPTASIEVYNVE